jgi:hypothetical protein
VKHRPWKACFWCPFSSESAVFTFSDLLRMWSSWYPNGLQIGPGRFLWDQKVSNSRVWKTWQKTWPNKVQTSVQIYSKKRVPKSDLLVIFKVPIPAWSPGRARGGSQAQKHVKMEAWTWIFCYLRCFHLLWRHFGNISCVPWRTNWWYSMLSSRAVVSCIPYLRSHV